MDDLHAACLMCAGEVRRGTAAAGTAAAGSIHRADGNLNVIARRSFALTDSPAYATASLKFVVFCDLGIHNDSSVEDSSLLDIGCDYED